MKNFEIFYKTLKSNFGKKVYYDAKTIDDAEKLFYQDFPKGVIIFIKLCKNIQS